MTPVYPVPLIKHVICFRVRGIRIPVGGDVGADVGEEVGALAGVGDGGFEADELAAVVEEDLAVAGEVVGFEGGGGEGGFRVEEAGQLGDESFSLGEDGLAEAHACCVGGEGKELRTFSSRSWMVASVCISSSVGFGGMVLA